MLRLWRWAPSSVFILRMRNGVENFQIARRLRAMTDNPMPQGAHPRWRELMIVNRAIETCNALPGHRRSRGWLARMVIEHYWQEHRVMRRMAYGFGVSVGFGCTAPFAFSYASVARFLACS